LSEACTKACGGKSKCIQSCKQVLGDSQQSDWLFK
jgi:hypothetical protein